MRGEFCRHELLRVGAAIFAITCLAPLGRTQVRPVQPDARQIATETLRKYCGTCHSSAVKTAGIVIDAAALGQPGSLEGSNAETWERVVRQLRAKSMPPVPMPRPDAATYAKVASRLESELDRQSALKPNPGNLPNLHR